MTIQVGDRVVAATYKDEGPGRVLELEDLFDQTFATIFFPSNKQVKLPVEDLDPIRSPFEKLQAGQITCKYSFLILHFFYKLKCRLTQEEAVSPGSFKIKPLPHQIVTINFVLEKFRARCLLADEVGLGKTIEAALIYEELKLRGIAKKALIICPASLLIQWQQELQSRFNENFVIYNKEVIRNLKSLEGEHANVWKLHNQIIASIDTVKPYKIDPELDDKDRQNREWHNQNVFSDIREAGFDLVIIDEAHYLSKDAEGNETARYKFGKEIADSVPVILLLTATPHQGDQRKFLNILKLLDPYRFKSTTDLCPENIRECVVRNHKRAAVDFSGKPLFRKRLTSLVQISRDPEENKDELGLYDTVTKYTSKFYQLAKQKNNQAMVFVIMLYQKIVTSSSAAMYESLCKRQSVLTEMLEHEDDKNPRLINNPLEEDSEEWLNKRISWEQRDLVKMELEFVVHAINLTDKLKTSFADVKLPKTIELIEEVKHKEDDEQVKIIIFVQFKGTQRYLLDYLSKHGFECAYINGDLNLEAKIEQSTYFRESAQILVSTDAGGEGINLQFCHVVINFDLPWNPGKLEQRIGRVDRIGQEKDILVFNLSLTDTIEDYVRQTLEEKLDLIKKQFGEDKHEEIVSLIQEEFSFDELYMAALERDKREKGYLEEIGQEIFDKASQIVNKNELLIPYAQDKSPKYDIKNIVQECIKPMINNYLAYNQIQPKAYKSDPYVFFFDNPFKSKAQDQPAVFRKATFNAELSSFRDDLSLLSIKHPFVQQLMDRVPEDFADSDSAAFEVTLSKFAGKSGLVFYYTFKMTNQIDKEYMELIPVVIDFETGEFNRRLSHLLLSLERMDIEVIPNFKPPEIKTQYLQEAKQAAQKQAEDIYYAKKLEWNRQLEEHTEKLKEYYALKEEAINDIRIDNIRAARLEDYYYQYKQEINLIYKKKNIVPNLQFLQVAYIEVKN